MNTTDPDNGEAHVWPWWRHVLLHLALWGTVGAIFAVQLRLYGVADWAIALRIAAVDWSPWILLGPLTFWLGQRVQFTRKRWQLPALAHLVGCLCVAFLLEGIALAALEHNWVGMPFRPRDGLGPPPMSRRLERFAPTEGAPSLEAPPPGPAGPPPEVAPVSPWRQPDGRPPGVGIGPPPGRPERAFIFRASRARAAIPIYWVIVAMAHASVYHRRALERERRALQAEARLTEARLAALQAQLNPHFLFNTLNTVVHYVRADPDAAEEMLTTLSDLLRGVLACSDRREVLLEQELAFVDHYLAIQRVRFSERLSVRKDIAPEALRATVPTLLLQPLVENAVIHGIAPERAPGTIHLRARWERGRLCIEIADTGKGAHDATPSGAALQFTERIGLSNTRARLAALYGPDFRFQITAASEGGVCVRIEIPHRVPTSP